MVKAQHSFSKHHYFGKTHKSRIVLKKKYNNIADSAFFSSEILLGNTNSWNGDLYNQYPSLQFIASYDNNKNFEIGVFGNLVSSSALASEANGADVFVSYRLGKKISFTSDVYTYFGNKNFLQNDLGYTAKLYQMYTGRFQYAIDESNSGIVGYSILNDKQSLQQSLFVEYDYNLKNYLTVILGYATDTNLLQFNQANINFGIGNNFLVFKKSKYPIKISTSFFPLIPFLNIGKFPIAVLFSIDL